MKRILKFVVVLLVLFTPIKACADGTDEYLAVELLENPQPNEIVLNSDLKNSNDDISDGSSNPIDE